LERFSMGVGDRFGQQGEAQLSAFEEARRRGIEVVPVWNKSNREHKTVGTGPESVRREADEAVRVRGWQGSYYVDADHIALDSVDPYIPHSDFFTIDVAAYIGQAAPPDAVRAFTDKHAQRVGTLQIPGIDEPLDVSAARIEQIADTFLLAVQEAGKIYRRIAEQKGAENCIFEVSLDETEKPQTPVDMLFILAAIADEGIPIQTIAPKFTGRFNKGVDYVGDVEQFAKEFEQDLAVVAYAIQELGLPDNLKLSVHSGSDKFSIFEPIRQAINKTGAGLHIKTAGTTWLEELIGLSLGSTEGLELAKQVYVQALDRFDELVEPYTSVIDINRERLPSATAVNAWNGEQFAAALRHVPSDPQFNPDLRQLLHVGYKIAAEMGEGYLGMVRRNAAAVAENVTENILERHLLRIFG